MDHTHFVFEKMIGAPDMISSITSGVFRMQLRTAVLVCNETSRRFENNNIQRTSLAREKVVYPVKYTFFF
jgi:hypothetical protein